MSDFITTEEVAEIFGVKPQTLRAGLCRDGNYMGLVPFKRPNRRLSWKKQEVFAVEEQLGRAEYTPQARTAPVLIAISDDRLSCTVLDGSNVLKFTRAEHV